MKYKVHLALLGAVLAKALLSSNSIENAFFQTPYGLIAFASASFTNFVP